MDGQDLLEWRGPDPFQENPPTFVFEERWYMGDANRTVMDLDSTQVLEGTAVGNLRTLGGLPLELWPAGDQAVIGGGSVDDVEWRPVTGAWRGKDEGQSALAVA